MWGKRSRISDSSLDHQGRPQIPRWIRAVSFALVLGVTFTISSAASALAAEIVTSAWRSTDTYSGYPYENRATGNDYGGAQFVTAARTRNDVSVPSGYIGTRGRGYSSDGLLICLGSWDYNYGSTNVWSSDCFTDNYGGRFYSKGLSRYWWQAGNRYSGDWATYATSTFTWG